MNRVLSFRKTDLFVPAAAVFISLVVFLLSSIPMLAGDKGGEWVVITVSGERYAVLPLNEDRELTIPGEKGLDNLLVIKDGYADIVEANCPDKVCVHQKKIRYKGETIVCLPHRVVNGKHESFLRALLPSLKAARKKPGNQAPDACAVHGGEVRVPG